ncbi:hypothetical protein CALCODRAFT_487643 [Calocera cornea HHB12733]|uniref:Uncharacterized protein n=1 Tax=Calocera cornea HHB12733 TaxID=1353952 RepID=A0A165D076_9BASI|nr:hypothetical protein CALCODRAFT_487643 [Calocera cornea HHB12733]
MSVISLDESEAFPPSSPPLSPVPEDFSDEISFLGEGNSPSSDVTNASKRTAVVAELGDDSDVESQEVKQPRFGRQLAAIHLYFTEPEGVERLRWCKACESAREKDSKLPEAMGRFSPSSGNSTLRNHLYRFHKGLWKKYQLLKAAKDTNFALPLHVVKHSKQFKLSVEILPLQKTARSVVD